MGLDLVYNIQQDHSKKTTKFDRNKIWAKRGKNTVGFGRVRDRSSYTIYVRIKDSKLYLFSFLFLFLFYFSFIFYFSDLGLRVSVTLHMTVTNCHRRM